MIDYLKIRPSSSTIIALGSIERFSGAIEHHPDFRRLAEAQNSPCFRLKCLCDLIELDSSSSLTQLQEVRSLREKLEQNDSQSSTPDTICLSEEFGSLFDNIYGEAINSPKQLLELRTKLKLKESKFRSIGNSSVLNPREYPLAPVSSFLVKSRITQLFSWYEQSIHDNTLHPLLSIALLHLYLIQIAPFPNGNQTLAAIVSGRALIAQGYQFIEISHPASFFRQSQDRYIRCLKDAERGFGRNSSSLNVWLDFFLYGLESSIESLRAQFATAADSDKLTKAQKQIIQAISEKGPLKRQEIVEATSLSVANIKYHLNILSKRGYLNKINSGRSTRYTL